MSKQGLYCFVITIELFKLLCLLVQPVAQNLQPAKLLDCRPVRVSHSDRYVLHWLRVAGLSTATPARPAVCVFDVAHTAPLPGHSCRVFRPSLKRQMNGCVISGLLSYVDQHKLPSTLETVNPTVYPSMLKYVPRIPAFGAFMLHRHRKSHIQSRH